MVVQAIRARLPGRRAAVCAAVAALLATDSMAQTQTGQLTVSATVQSGCTLSGGTLDFGTYVAGQAAALDATGQIGFLNCTGVLTFELDGGQQGDVNARRMRGPEGVLAYQIYRNTARTAVWGASGNALQVQLAGATPASGTVPVYGRIAGGQSVPGGAYADLINITLTF